MLTGRSMRHRADGRGGLASTFERDPQRHRERHKVQVINRECSIDS
jgi:hypothetical protein